MAQYDRLENKFEIVDHANRGRVALFLSEYIINSQVANTVRLFIQNGYCVDIFLFKPKGVFTNLETNDRLTIYDMTRLCGGGIPANKTQATKTPLSLVKNIILKNTKKIRFVKALFRNIWKISALVFSNDDIFPGKVRVETKRMLERKTYKCFIGLERMGFIWASMLGVDLQIPCVYFSLELYTMDYPDYSGYRFFYSKRLERKYHKLAVATIIQDGDRANVLFKDNNVPKNRKTFFVPVSLMGAKVITKSDYLRKKFGIAEHVKILLQFGQIAIDKKSSLDLAAFAQNLPDKYVLVMHGIASEKTIEKIKRVNYNQKVIMSLEKVDFSEVYKVISSADIGISFYRNGSMNDYLTGSASEKMALYAQSGIPMISFNYPSFENIYKKYKCGIGISSFNELIDSADKILANYSQYRNNAYKCYEEHYRFENHFQKVIDWAGAL